MWPDILASAACAGAMHVSERPSQLNALRLRGQAKPESGFLIGGYHADRALIEPP
jgi:hypothetical protein